MAFAYEIMRGGFSAGQASSIGGGANTAVVATGSTRATATAIVASMNIVTGADGTKGVTLPAAQTGDSVIIANNQTAILKVFPPLGAAIGTSGTSLGNVNSSYGQAADTYVSFVCMSATQWLAMKSG